MSCRRRLGFNTDVRVGIKRLSFDSTLFPFLKSLVMHYLIAALNVAFELHDKRILIYGLPLIANDITAIVDYLMQFSLYFVAVQALHIGARNRLVV
jgi:hypothetical protein